MKRVFCIAVIIFLPFGAKCQQLPKQRYYYWWQVYSLSTFSEMCEIKGCAKPREIFKNEQTSVYISFQFSDSYRARHTVGNCIFYIEHAYPNHYLTLKFDSNGNMFSGVHTSEVTLDLGKEGIFVNGGRFSGNSIRKCCYDVAAKEF